MSVSLEEKICDQVQVVFTHLCFIILNNVWLAGKKERVKSCVQYYRKSSCLTVPRYELKRTVEIKKNEDSKIRCGN